MLATLTLLVISLSQQPSSNDDLSLFIASDALKLFRTLEQGYAMKGMFKQFALEGTTPERRMLHYTAVSGPFGCGERYAGLSTTESALLSGYGYGILNLAPGSDFSGQWQMHPTQGACRVIPRADGQSPVIGYRDIITNHIWWPTDRARLTHPSQFQVLSSEQLSPAVVNSLALLAGDSKTGTAVLAAEDGLGGLQCFGIVLDGSSAGSWLYWSMAGSDVRQMEQMQIRRSAESEITSVTYAIGPWQSPGSRTVIDVDSFVATSSAVETFGQWVGNANTPVRDELMGNAGLGVFDGAAIRWHPREASRSLRFTWDKMARGVGMVLVLAALVLLARSRGISRS